MEGDVIVLQDVFLFEQTGVRRRQGPGPPARRPASARASPRSSRRTGIHLPPRLFGSPF